MNFKYLDELEVTNEETPESTSPGFTFNYLGEDNSEDTLNDSTTEEDQRVNTKGITFKYLGGKPETTTRINTVESTGEYPAVTSQGEPKPSVADHMVSNYPDGLSPDDISQDETLRASRDRFLRARFGDADVDFWDEGEKQESFLQVMRGFSSGNSIRTFREIAFIKQTSDENREAYNEGVTLFEGLNGMFSKNYNIREKGEAVVDYGRSVLLDPVNLVGGLIAKGFLSGGRKVAGAVGAKVAAEELAKEGTSQTFKSFMKGMSTKAITSGAAKEVLMATSVDILISVGLDAAYQEGLTTVGYQDEHQWSQSALAALGGLVGGAAQLGFVVARGKGNRLVQLPEARSLDKPDHLKELTTLVVGDLQRAANANAPQVPIRSDWATKVGSGNEIVGLDTDFWYNFIRGDENLGFKGLIVDLFEGGFRFSPRYEGDNITNYMADALRNMPEEDAMEFIPAFEKAYGVDLSSLGSPTRTMETLGNDLARKLHDSARVMQASSYAAKVLGKKYTDVSFEDISRVILGDLADEPPKELTPLQKTMGKLKYKIDTSAGYLQGKYTELLVSNAATSVLNLSGWVGKNVGDTAVDILRGTLFHLPVGLVEKLVLNRNSRNLARAKNIMASNVTKLKNLVDPYTTYDNFMSLVRNSPSDYESFVYTVGGVEDTSRELSKFQKAAIKRFGLSEADVAKPLWHLPLDTVVDNIKRVSLVKAVDVFTKSQELMFRLDQNVRDSYDMSLGEFLAQPNLNIVMSTNRYKTVLAKSLAQAEETVMAKSYKNIDNHMISYAASTIEDFRKIPGIGVLIPFGRFFNNTVATMSEYSGATALMKPIISGVGDSKEYPELIAKGAAGWALMYTLSLQEEEYIKEGIPFNQARTSSGDIIDHSANFPYIAAKIGARIMAYQKLKAQDPNWELPSEEFETMGEVLLGGLTRNLSSAESTVVDIAKSIASGETTEAASQLFETLGGIGSTAVSGATRWMEPINTFVALSRDPDDPRMLILDPKQGRTFFVKSFRYTDQFFQQFGMDFESEPKVDPVNEYTARSADKFVGSKATPPQTAARKVFAMIGHPEWDLDLKSDDPHANNYINEVVRPILEFNMESLLSNPDFVRAPNSVKKTNVQAMLTLSREQAKAYLKNTFNTTNNRIGIVFDLTSNATVSQLDQIIRDQVDPDLSLEDLSFEQLEALKAMMDGNKEYLQRRYGLKP